MASTPPTKILTLQAGRALAAIAVLLFHTRNGVESTIAPLPAWLGLPLSYGYLGVDFFFVLSGFIIYHTNADHAPGLPWLRRYAKGRLIRIYTPYLPIGIGIALVYAVLPGLAGHGREWSWLSSITLLPTAHHPALNVAWTLQNELVFYGLFCIFFLARRPIAGVAAWALLTIVSFLVFRAELVPIAVFGLINIEFLLGVTAAWIVRSGRIPDLAFAPVALAGLVAFSLFTPLWQEGVGRVFFALAVAAVLVPIVRAERGGRIAVPAVMVLLGEASYAIYLIHTPLISAILRVAPRQWALAFLLITVVVLLAALAYHLWYEKPAMALIRARLGGGKAGAEAASARPG